MERPSLSEYAPHFHGYVSRVAGADILSTLRVQQDAFAATVAVPEERAAHRYAEGKWSVREVVGHVLDGERVFAYRALCIARGEQTSLPSFDEQEYMAVRPFDGYTQEDLVAEWRPLRSANISLLAHLDATAWTRVGKVDDHPTTARAIAFVMAGHVDHHLSVLRERYGL